MKRFLMLAGLLPALAFGQTQTRNNAGLKGDEGATSGFFETSTPINYPSGATSWWHLIDVRHSNPNNNYAMQFSGSFYDQNLYFRKTIDNAARPWSRILTELDGNTAIGPTEPQSYFHGGNNRVLEIFNPNATYNSQSHVVLSNNSTDANSAAGSITWISKNSTQNKGLAYIGVASAFNSSVNASGNMYLATANAGTPTIKMVIDYKGDVGIGTMNPNEKLAVNGNIRAKEIKVETANWPDYVFAPDYQNTSLTELEKYIKSYQHLPDMPSAKEVETDGISLGEMNSALLKKVEELTLHLIKQEKRIEELENTQKKRLK